MDKDNVHIDNEFTDHSWREMSKLLDQEMPVKKRKKRLVWIWFLGLGLLGLIGFAYLQQDNRQNLKSFPVPAITKKVATKSNDKKVTHQSLTSNKSIKKVSKQSISTKSSDNTSVISTIKNPTKQFPTAADTPTAVGVGISVLAQNDFVKIKVASKSENGISNTPNTSQSTPKKLNFQFIPIVSLSPTLLAINNKEEISTPIFPIKNSLKWRFGIYASTLAPKFGSFRSGLHANILFNHKWTLHFGLGYAKRISSTTSTANNNQEFASPIPDVIEMEDMNTTAGTGVGNDPTPSTNPNPNEIELIPNNQGITFSNFHYFEIPLLINYRIQSKFSLELGGSFSYLHGYRYQYKEASFFSNNADLSGAFDTTRSTDLSLANAPTISTINWTLIGGANYQLSNNLTAYANYHYSTPYLKAAAGTAPDKKRWQQMEVGIRYYFK